MEEAIKLGKFKSKEQAVNTALAEYIQFQKRRALVALAGKINYLPDYDYKKLRSRNSKCTT